jgi:hypothetical protein
MAQAVTGALTTFDLTVARQVPLQQLHILIVNVINFFGAEPADFFRVKISHYFSYPLALSIP